MTPTPALQTDALTRRYGRTVALAPTSITVPPAAIFALLGHNGAGKTTLLKLAMNILHRSAGTAAVLGQPSATLTGDAFTRIGYVSENQELPGWMTVRAFLAYQSGFYPQWDDAALVRRFDLPLDRKLKNLSRGQRMKAALASILAFSPALIVLDEPFSGLDPLVRDELIEALLDTVAVQSATANPTTIVLSSHDLAEIESFCTHVAFLQSGTLLFSEEMAALAGRFREVTVTLATAAEALPGTISPSWLNPQLAAHTLRFIHAHADTEPVAAQVRALYPHATAIELEPMSLRAIFLALARSGRAPTEDAASTPSKGAANHA